MVDTGSKFTIPGQLIILVLIQMGGLGLMTFSTTFALIIKRKMSVKEKLIIREGLNKYGLSDTRRVIWYIIIFTFIMEILGALLLYLRWDNVFPTPHRRLYLSLFHSISAFCNAGFSLFSNSLERFAFDPVTVLVITSLIIVGGLGFFVNYEIKNFIARKFTFIRKLFKLRSFSIHMSLHTKIVLSTSLVLIVFGVVMLNLLDINQLMRDKGVENRLLIGYFQSVTARTAGFNTITIRDLTNSSWVILIVLMFIGGSPGSTAGGIKTTTMATLFLTLKSMFRGRDNVEAYNRTLPKIIIRKTIVIFTMGLGLILTAFVIIMAIEQKKFLSLPVLFEITSAFGTVGLSTGITSSLSPLSKLVLIVLMFVGRIGPLTIAISMVEKEKYLIKYPDEKISVG